MMKISVIEYVTFTTLSTVFYVHWQKGNLIRELKKFKHVLRELTSQWCKDKF